jgi:hypothetical protein
MMGMVVDVESLPNDLCHALPGPQVGRKPRGQGALDEDPCECFHSRLGQPGWSPGGRLRPQAFEAVALDDRFPSPDRRRRHFQRTNHLDVFLAGQKQPARGKTPSFLLLFGSKCSFHAYSYAATCKAVHYFCDGQ